MAARFRLDTTSLRSLYNQQIHGSKRSLRSVEDFSEFEQRTAYFNGDHVSATCKGVNLPNRPNQVAMMAQMQNIIDFPIELVGTRVLEDRVASILPYFDDPRLPPWARHLTRPARAAAATLLRQARQWRAPIKADLPLVKKPFAQVRPKIDRL